MRGDERAFTALYHRHHQELYRYARSILRHDQDAQDALQSTMAKAFAALQHEQRDFEVRPWLFRIAHNEAISLLRRRRPTERLESAEALPSDGLAQQVEDRRRLAELEADLADLPERQRAALLLRELNGLSHEEVAVVLDSTARAVKQTIFEARTGLHECAEGRSMPCEDVRRAISDADGRVLRGRRLRAHLRDCASCRGFKAAIGQRESDLAALVPPLPVAGAAAVLAHLLPGSGSAGGLAGAAGASSAPATGWLGAGVATKVAVVAAAAATATGGAGVALHVERRAGDRPAGHVERRAADPARRPADPTATTSSPPPSRTAPNQPAKAGHPVRGRAPSDRGHEGGDRTRHSGTSASKRGAAGESVTAAGGRSAGAAHRSGAPGQDRSAAHPATPPGARPVPAPRRAPRAHPTGAARRHAAGGASPAGHPRRRTSGASPRAAGSAHASAAPELGAS